MAIQIQLRRDTSSNWTSSNPVLAQGEFGVETNTGKFKIGNGSTAWNSLSYSSPSLSATSPITYSDGVIGINQGSIAIAQSQVTNLTTDLSAKASLSGATFTGAVSGTDLTLSGNLTVNGTTTNINTQNLIVEDKNIIIGDVATPTDTTADGGGITLKGTTDKTFNWVDATDAWTSSEDLNLASGKVYEINGTTVLSSTQVLGKSMPSGTVVGTSDSQTLTNKTLTSPVISTISNTGTVTLPTATDTLVGRATSDTLTNKSIALGSNTVTGTTAQFNTALTDGDFATLAGSETLSNKTLTAPRFATAGEIDDANGNELIKFPATVASAVNEITVSNAAAGGTPSIAATGDSTNISLNLVSKGTGTVQANGVQVLTTTGTAASATNLAGGSAGQVPYQSASGTTLFTSTGTAGQVLTSNGTSAPTWSAPAESGFNAFLLSGM